MQTKFIISEEGKDYVLAAVGRLWRRHKSIVKKKHFSAYDNDNDKLANAPDNIPKAYFQQLLDFWNLDITKVIAILLCYLRYSGQISQSSFFKGTF